MTTITHNQTAHRFETTIDGQYHLSYQQNGDVLNYNHTIVPNALGVDKVWANYWQNTPLITPVTMTKGHSFLLICTILLPKILNTKIYWREFV